MKNVLMLLDKEFPGDDRVEKEALSLIQSGFHVSILCPTFKKKSKKEAYKGIQIYRFALNKTLFNKILGLIQLFPFYKYLWLSNISKIAKDQNLDIVHIHDLPLCCTISGIKKNRKVKIVADMHENYPAMVAGQEHMKKFPNKYLISIKKWYELEKIWLINADVIICTASGMVHRLKSVLGSDKRFVLVPNTIDINEFKACQKDDPVIAQKFTSDFVLLSYGVVSEQRGIQYVIDAVHQLKDKIQNIKLVVLGDGAYLKDLIAKAEALNIRDHIAFEGWQNQSMLISYMRNTDICLIPHIKSEHTDNTSPNKLFHFMYFGKPVIASDCNYIQEIVEEEQCGLIYNYADTKALADCIMDLYLDKKKRTRLGMNGEKAIFKKYNWSSTVMPMIEEYTKLANIN